MRHSQDRGTLIDRVLRSLSPEDAFVALATRRALHGRDLPSEAAASARYERLRSLSRAELEHRCGRRGSRFELLAELVARGSDELE